MSTPEEVADYNAAKAVAPYGNEALVSTMTESVVASGHAILQIFRVGATDREHVAQLLRWFAPASGATVLDVGCGVGEVARLMGAARPDLNFILLNISPAQLGMCGLRFPRVGGDCGYLPIASRSVDAVLFCYSLGHALLDQTMSEAARVLRNGGVLFIYDLASDDSGALIHALGYKAHPAASVLRAAADAGLSCDMAFAPEATADGFFRLMDRDTFANVFRSVVPVAYRFTKTFH